MLYTDNFATASGKASCGWASRKAASEQAPGEQGTRLMATLGFPLFPFRSGTLSRQSYALSRVEPDPRLHLNTQDAAGMGIADQVPVHVTVDGAPETNRAGDVAGVR